MTTVADSPYPGRGPAVDKAPACFHCSEPVLRGVHHEAVIDGVRRVMCCAGCEAVARTIVENGRGDYYRQRRELPARAAAVVRDELRQYDLPAVQARFVDATEDAEGRKKLAGDMLRAPISLEKMTYDAATGTVISRSKMHVGLKRNFELMSGAQWLELLCRHIPDRYEHLVRYLGWYSNRAPRVLLLLCAGPDPGRVR